MGLWDYFVIALVAGAAVAAVIWLARRPKNSGCTGCPYAGSCPGKVACETKKENK